MRHTTTLDVTCPVCGDRDVTIRLEIDAGQDGISAPDPSDAVELIPARITSASWDNIRCATHGTHELPDPMTYATDHETELLTRAYHEGRN